MNEQKVNKEDTIRLVRIATKCSDCLTDYDTITDLIKAGESKYIKHELKKELPLFGEYIDTFSKRFIGALAEANEKTTIDISKKFTDFNRKIFVINEEMTALCLSYAKAQSILNDIEEMEYSDMYLDYLKVRCKAYAKIVKGKYYSVMQLKDKGGYSVEDIIKGLDILGKSIMHEE
jgi:hypothetical protein